MSSMFRVTWPELLVVKGYDLMSTLDELRTSRVPDTESDVLPSKSKVKVFEMVVGGGGGVGVGVAPDANG